MIELSRQDIENPPSAQEIVATAFQKRYEAITDFLADIERIIREAEECVAHEMDFALLVKSFRRYRRGKERCLRCGCIILNRRSK